MRLWNYMNLNQQPVHVSLYKDQTTEFEPVYHAHQGMEMLYVHQGSGQAIVGKQVVTIRNGTLLLLRPFQLHRVRIDLTQLYIRTIFVFEPEFAMKLLAPFPELLSFLKGLLKPQSLQYSLASISEDKIKSLVGLFGPIDIDLERDLQPERKGLALIAMLSLLKEELLELQPDIQHGVMKTTIERIMDWVDQHYHEPFRLQELAKEVHLSEHHVSTLFKQQTGSSLTEYVAARRIRQACWLLKTSPDSLDTIAASIGVGSTSYFCEFFKKHTGISPHQYRMRHRKGLHE